MKILFTGLPYFGKRLVAELNEIDPKNKYVFCDTYYSKKDQLRFLWHLLSAKKVVSFNGASSESGSLNWVLRMKKELIMQWHGSDVLTAQQNIISGNFTRKYIDASRSFTDAPWLLDELLRLKIDANILHFKSVELKNKSAPFLSKDVLTYLSKGKELFYGYKSIVKLATEFKDTTFHVVGTDGLNLNAPHNIKFYGWVDQIRLEELMDLAPIYLRFCEHDGYSLSVLQALANGNYVIYNNAMPFVNFAATEDSLKLELNKIQKSLTVTNGQRNNQANSFLLEFHQAKIVLENYSKVLTQTESN
jgi:hypothetical protein